MKKLISILVALFLFTSLTFTQNLDGLSLKQLESFLKTSIEDNTGIKTNWTVESSQFGVISFSVRPKFLQKKYEPSVYMYICVMAVGGTTLKISRTSDFLYFLNAETQKRAAWISTADCRKVHKMVNKEGKTINEVADFIVKNLKK